MVLGVGPVHVVSGVIDRESVGPVEVPGRQGSPLTPVHPSALQTGCFPPVRPKHEAEEKDLFSFLSSLVTLLETFSSVNFELK